MLAKIIERISARQSLDYGRWVAKYDTIKRSDRVAISRQVAALRDGPLISIVVVMGEASEAALSRSIASLKAQLNPFWELCVTADHSADVVVEPAGTSAARDSRIRVVATNSRLSPEAASNAAVDAASGEFLGFLRSGDILPEHSLYEVLVAIRANPSVDILYTDCDEIDALGRRSNPWFKPGWDPDLLLAQDYLNDLIVYRRALLEKVGLFRLGFDDANLYDLALRATAATTPNRIVHVPAILHHKFHKLGPSDAQCSMLDAGRAERAVRDHLDSSGYKDAEINSAPLVANARRIVWPLPRSLPLVSVIIPTRDRAELLDRCLSGVLHRTDYNNLEILIVDNDSTESATLALFDRLIRTDKRVKVLRSPGPFNYSALNNAAAREAQGDVLLLLNNDIDVIRPDWLREMVSHAVRPDVGIVGAKLLYADSRIQHAGVVFAPGGQMHHLYALAAGSEIGYRDQLVLVRSLSAVTAACAAIRRSVFWEVDGLNETDLAIAFNDVDLCLRLGDYGYRVIWTPFAELFHLESASRGPENSPEKRARFQAEWSYMRRTWGLLLEGGDPFHNPNLLLAGSHIEIPCQPRREKPWRRLRK